MSDLKACPFCGRIPDIEDCGEHRWFIRCKCGIAQDKLFFQKCDAVRAWNKRKELLVKDTNVPITDTISRQAAIDALAKHEKSKGHNYTLFVDIVSECAEIIRDLPPAQQWIPFSERLPEANRVVLLAFSHNAVVGYWIDILPDGKPIWYAATGNGWATDIDCENYGYPTAWMPVPELYKGGEEDED